MRTVRARWLCLPLVLALLGCGNQRSDEALGSFRAKEPLTVVVTFPPGGGTDWLARKLGAELQTKLGVPVVIDNKPGASGNIGAKLVADAKPDGHTLLMVNSSFAINPGVFQRLEFDPRQDFAAVINVGFVPSILVVHSDTPWQNLPQVLAQATADAPLAFASCGNGTPQHLAGEMLARAKGVHLQQVPYKGCGPALAAVMGKQVPMAIITATSAASMVQAGKLRGLAVTSPQRFAALPNVPTVAEQGVQDYAVDQWHGLLAPAATPAATVAQLNRALREILQIPEVAAAVTGQGFALDISSPERFQQLLRADIERYAKVTQAMGLRVD